MGQPTARGSLPSSPSSEQCDGHDPRAGRLALSYKVEVMVGGARYAVVRVEITSRADGSVAQVKRTTLALDLELGEAKRMHRILANPKTIEHQP